MSNNQNVTYVNFNDKQIIEDPIREYLNNLIIDYRAQFYVSHIPSNQISNIPRIFTGENKHEYNSLVGALDNLIKPDVCLTNLEDSIEQLTSNLSNNSESKVFSQLLLGQYFEKFYKVYDVGPFIEKQLGKINTDEIAKDEIYGKQFLLTHDHFLETLENFLLDPKLIRKIQKSRHETIESVLENKLIPISVFQGEMTFLYKEYLLKYSKLSSILNIPMAMNLELDLIYATCNHYEKNIMVLDAQSKISNLIKFFPGCKNIDDYLNGLHPLKAENDFEHFIESFSTIKKVHEIINRPSIEMSECDYSELSDEIYQNTYHLATIFYDVADYLRNNDDSDYEYWADLSVEAVNFLIKNNPLHIDSFILYDDLKNNFGEFIFEPDYWKNIRLFNHLDHSQTYSLISEDENSEIENNLKIENEIQRLKNKYSKKIETRALSQKLSIKK